MGVSTTFCTGRKNCHLGLSSSPGNKFLWPMESKYEIVYFYVNFFHFTKKVFEAFDFFFEIFYHTTPSSTQMTFLTDFYYLIKGLYK